MRRLDFPSHSRTGWLRSPIAQGTGIVRADRWSADGFLLVEALATLVISALILLGLASILGLMLRAGDRIAGRAETLETTGRAVAALERELRLIARARWAGAARTSFVFQGGPDAVLFARDMRQANGLAVTRIITLQSVATEAGSRLLRAEALLIPGATSLADVALGPAEELYQGRFIFRFVYSGRLNSADPEIVSASWPSATRLPSTIRIDLTDAATGVLTASLRVRLLIEAEPGCAKPDAAFCSLIDRDDGGSEGASAAGETGFDDGEDAALSTEE